VSSLRPTVRNAGSSRRQAAGVQAVRLFAFTLLLACADDWGSEPSRPSAPVTSIQVRATTSGDDLDATGYLVRIGGAPGSARVNANGSVTFFGFPVGNHAIGLADVAPNCTVTGGPFIATITSPGQTVVVDIQVVCVALGAVDVTVTMTGADPDANGFAVAVEGLDFTENASAPAAINGTRTVAGIAPGRHLVRLRGVAANCGDGDELRAREVDVVSSAKVAVAFRVVCTPATWIAYTVQYTVTNTEIFVVRSNGSGDTRLTDHPARDEDPAWSPDGTRIAFTSDRDGSRAVHVMNGDGSGVTRLTPTEAASYDPAWSPDGHLIAFVSERDGNAELYVMNADGTNQRRLTNHPAIDRDPAWSPEGTRIAFSSARDGNAEIYVMGADGTGLARITTSSVPDGHPAWSPDGNRLAFAHGDCIHYTGASGCSQAVIFVTSPTGSGAIDVGAGDAPSWSPDGLKLAVTGYTCGYDFYYDYCTVTGIGILTPVAAGPAGYVDTWAPELTRGMHFNPSWRP
jgi:hypothetical protein